MNKIKILSLAIGLMLISALTFVGFTNAQSFEAGDEIIVAESKTIDSMFFAGGNNINIAGTVNGDVFCAGETVNISGNIKGDVFCIGQSITISGDIDGSVRLAGRNIVINGNIINNATIAAQNLIIDEMGVIGKDLLGGSQIITVKGKVSRDITSGATSLNIDGIVGRDINGYIDSIHIGSNSVVSGEVRYTGENELVINKGGKIVGAVTRTEPTNQEVATIEPMESITAALGEFIYAIISIGIIAVLLALIFPRSFEEATNNTIKSPVITVAVGIVAAIVMPIVIITLLITFVGIPLAMFVLLAWIFVLVISTYFAAYLLGKLVLKGSKKPILIMLVGISILTFANIIPFINFLTFLAAGSFGIGSFLMYGKQIIKSQK